MTEKINEIKISRKASNYLVCSFTRKNRVPISLKKKKKNTLPTRSVLLWNILPGEVLLPGTVLKSGKISRNLEQERSFYPQ